MKHIGVLVALFALFVVPGYGAADDRQNSPRASTTGVLALSGASEELRLGGSNTPATLAIEAQLRFENVLGLLSLVAEGRHFVSRNAYWRDKTLAAFGADIPLGRDALLFARWERRYRSDDDFTMAGIRLKWGSSRK